MEKNLEQSLEVQIVALPVGGTGRLQLQLHWMILLNSWRALSKSNTKGQTFYQYAIVHSLLPFGRHVIVPSLLRITPTSPLFQNCLLKPYSTQWDELGTPRHPLR
jgi:hypothetical protein